MGKVATALQLGFAALTAVCGFYFKMQQDRLDSEQKRIGNEQAAIKTNEDRLKLHTDTTGETEKFVGTTQAILDKLDLDSKQRQAILIDLLDAIALATVSTTGRTDKAKLEHMPLSIALATRNVEALGLIGLPANRRNAWYDLARVSGDPNVKKTAMEALALSSSRDPTDHMVKIFELSDRLNDDKTLDSALEQISRVVSVMSRDADPARFRESPLLHPVVARLDGMSTSLATGAATKDAHPGASDADVHQAAEDLARRTTLVKEAVAFLKGGDTLQLAAATPAPPPPPPASPSGTTPAPPPSAGIDVPSNIQQLKSDDTETRRQSRLALADAGDAGLTDQLLAELAKDPGNYRLRIGVATVLYQATKPVVIRDPARARTGVNLIGDEDVLVRKYASEALMKLTDPESVRVVHARLSEIIGQRSAEGVSDNGVYNAVVILGTWVRILPDGLAVERVALALELRKLLVELAREERWTKTAALIRELLDSRGTPEVAGTRG